MTSVRQIPAENNPSGKYAYEIKPGVCVEKKGEQILIILRALLHTLLQHLLAMPPEWSGYLFPRIWKRLKISGGAAVAVPAATRGCRWSNTSVK